MIEDNDFFLTDGERRHPLWLRLRAYMEKQLANLHGKIEGDLKESETAIIRGRIKMLKALCALGDDPPMTG